MSNSVFDGLEKFLFVIVFLAGSIAIVALKLTDWSQAWVTAFPVICMIAYAIRLSYSDSLDTDIAGENLYYLGFLYTLTSLGLSLYQFVDLGGTQAIISNFGIALITTIVGVLFRVMFHQIREDPSTIESKARLELGQASRKLRVELDQSVLDFNSFRRELVQSIDEGAQEIRDRLKQNFEAAATEGVQFAQNMQNTTAEFGEYAAMMRKTARQHATATDKTASAIEALFSRVEQIEVPSDLLEKKLAPLITELSFAVQQTVERAKKEEERIVPLKELIDAAVQLTNILQRNVEAMSEQVKATQSTAILQSREVLQTLSREREKYQESVDRHVDQLQETIAEFRKANEADRGLFQHGVNDNLDKMKTTIRDLQTTSSTLFTDWSAATKNHFSHLNDLMRALERASGTLVQSWEEGANAMHTLARSTEQDLTAVRKHREALEAELEKSQKLVGMVHSSLASMTALIVERLNGK